MTFGIANLDEGRGCYVGEVPVAFILDDEPLNIAALQRALGTIGFKVFGATNLRDAEHQLARERADVIIADIATCEGCLESAQAAFKRHSPDAALVFLTAVSEHVLTSSGLALEGLVLLDKPIDLEILASIARKAVQ